MTVARTATSASPASPWPDRRRIAVVTDPPDGWFAPHAEALTHRLRARGHDACSVSRQEEVPAGDIAFYLSCTRLTPPGLLARNRWNLVVHASALPRGRGFSPLAWQVLEGRNDIPLTMITMAREADAGDIVMQRHLRFRGHELNDEMRARMGAEITGMCFELATAPAPPVVRPQEGEPSHYPRRRPADSRLDPHRTLADQFDLLRTVDNDRYPAFFDLRGHRYVLKIHRQHEGEEG
ncbi:formyltransferase family protein [Gymnodinialimonas ceratoperidinii]|uniref:Formyl transferase N-terminal domain-containing protein n=1 Tax=Gymnodinialimonas ceratoperidinii TaxID=2856823 RepID=A0A8F6YCN0_9RHOB|nr:formyltransferase family protein [Gymnodinialimonas ceratoperidinii]QXT39382.1 hypothetical protein KYE46_15865 [Gymnodinialimonas ceratoperidinii]